LNEENKGQRKMTVKELIEELKKYNPDAEIVSITVGGRNEWEYTNNPKTFYSKNRYGERVWIK
jgi:hypothetical protein